ncbi:hypothetical protein [Mycoplasmopsis gallinacea]|uniref:Uncharacterized protein n=1 Tax=Mycoplasmopsis gallinacea TaxID=29556 RepID=A0A6H0V5V4_9BACT|nr:hypothetical protein [Mycoplasmopsis gallinacea]QIW62353.1 hypothetical protein GOQ20_02875 [Mycoplasmopsis gallinacea]
MNKEKQDEIATQVNEFLSNVSMLYSKYTNKEIDMEEFLSGDPDFRQGKEIKAFFGDVLEKSDYKKILNQIYSVLQYIIKSNCPWYELYINPETEQVHNREEIEEIYIENKEYENQTLPNYIKNNYFEDIDEFCDYLNVEFDETEHTTLAIWIERMQVIDELDIQNNELYVHFWDKKVLDKEDIKEIIITSTNWNWDHKIENFDNQNQFEEFLSKIKNEDFEFTKNQEMNM